MPAPPAMRHPLERALHDSGFLPDPAQRQAIAHLRRLHDELLQAPSGNGGLLSRWFGDGVRPVRGLYLWGGVGRGKTHLIDSLCDVLPLERKLRLHFHRFMREVHARLRDLGGIDNPLVTVAGGFAERTRVLFLDEMQVIDITDAMLIHGLLDALFAAGVTLVTTSNSPPDELYRDGLQRQRFVPAIALLEQHTAVVHLDGAIDYRLRALEQAEIWHSPLDDDADRCLADNFAALITVPGDSPPSLRINERDLTVVRCAEGVAWFTFTELCDAPRSSHDYIEIARLFHTVLLAGVPVMGESSNDQARRFVNLIDEFYDRNIKLIVSAAATPDALYTGSRLTFEFERTASRLLEMQSHDYLGRAHLS